MILYMRTKNIFFALNIVGVFILSTMVIIVPITAENPITIQPSSNIKYGIIQQNNGQIENWAGQEFDGPTGSVTYVSGQWTVPAVKQIWDGYEYAYYCGGADYSQASAWVGIDGGIQLPHTVEQVGVTFSADCIPDQQKAYYWAWYEFYPAFEVDIGPSYPVQPGDEMYGSVYISGTTIYLTLEDQTAGWSNNIHATNTCSTFNTCSGSGYTAQGSSAEWIEESFNMFGNPQTYYGSIPFTYDFATINGNTNYINVNFGSDITHYVDNSNYCGLSLSTASSITGLGAFTTTFHYTSTTCGVISPGGSGIVRFDYPRF